MLSLILFMCLHTSWYALLSMYLICPPSDRGALGPWSLALTKTCLTNTSRSEIIEIVIQQNNTRNEQILVINTIIGKNDWLRTVPYISRNKWTKHVCTSDQKDLTLISN